MRKYSVSQLFLLTILFISASCTTVSGPLFIQEPITPDADPNLYLYRPSSALMAGAKWEFAIDKDIVVNLSNGTYARLPLKPGKHQIMAGGASNLDQPPLMHQF